MHGLSKHGKNPCTIGWASSENGNPITEALAVEVWGCASTLHFRPAHFLTAWLLQWLHDLLMQQLVLYGCSTPAATGLMQQLVLYGCSTPAATGLMQQPVLYGCSTPAATGLMQQLVLYGCSTPAATGLMQQLVLYGCSTPAATGLMQQPVLYGCSWPAATGLGGTFSHCGDTLSSSLCW